jgi:hypothetical protein
MPRCAQGNFSAGSLNYLSGNIFARYNAFFDCFLELAVHDTSQGEADGTGARFGDSFGLGREALLMGHNCPVFDRCQPA